MLRRFRLTLFVLVVILGLILAGCTTAAGQETAEPPAASTLAPEVTPPAEEPAGLTETPAAQAATPTAAPPTAAPDPTAAPPAEPTAETASAVTTDPEAPAASAAELRTFRVVSEQSQTYYQVQEEFFNRPVNFFNPIGRTQSIEGEFQLSIAGRQVQLAENHFTVDLRTLASDDARRDQRIRNEWLESNTYPWAEFTATAIEDFPADATEGQDISFKLIGDMTIREITRPQTFDVTARLDGNTFTGVAATQLLMRDYGFEPPEILGSLKVTDGVTVTVEFVAQEAGGAS